jgi:UDP-N-acetylmuramate dehydrogenase
MLDAGAKQWLTRLLGENVRFDEPMARHTSFRIGGPADALAEPETQEQLIRLLQWTHTEHIGYVVLGGGTNLLVLDGGIRGLAIGVKRLNPGPIWSSDHQGVRLTAEAGLATRKLCALCLRNGWQGMNFALGIPGTIGGAVMMNAGTAHGCMADIVQSVLLLSPRGERIELSRKELEFEYRHLRMPEQAAASSTAQPVLLQVELQLSHADPAAVRARARRMMQARAAGQPSWQPSAGCFFQNPAPGMPAGRLIEAAGLKGCRMGDAQVSARHANFIINRGRATAADVLQLMVRIQQAVKQHCNIWLEPEVRIVGQKADT